MPGESVLLIDDSSAEREFAEQVLEDAGYNVVSAANAAAALNYPDVQNINLIVMDAMLDSVSGYETTRLLRQQESTHPIPVLMLIPDETVGDREDLSARGANGFLLKPFDAKALAGKVGRLLEEQHLEDLSRQYLANMADKLMEDLADKHIKEAVERKTQIIVERCIQNVASAVDKQARSEVDQRIATLAAEKEQELVKLTVREVAQSMVEKLAERKVTEALDQVLQDQAERAVKRISDEVLPGTVRDRVKDSLSNLLPREIQVRLQKAAEKMAPELSGELIATVEGIAGKTIPRVAREQMPELIERQTKAALAEQVPRMVNELVGRELIDQMNRQIEPAIREASRSIRRNVLIWNMAMGGIVALGLALTVYMNFFAGQ